MVAKPVILSIFFPFEFSGRKRRLFQFCFNLHTENNFRFGNVKLPGSKTISHRRYQLLKNQVSPVMWGVTKAAQVIHMLSILGNVT